MCKRCIGPIRPGPLSGFQKKKRKESSLLWRRRRRRRRRIRMITVSEVSSFSSSSSNFASLSRLNYKSSSRFRSSSLYRASFSVSTKTRNTCKAKSWNLGLVINSRRYFFFQISIFISDGFYLKSKILVLF